MLLKTVSLYPLFVCVLDCCLGLTVKIGILFSSNRCCDILSFEDKASAMNIAIDHLARDGILDKTTVSFKIVWGDASTEAAAVGETIHWILDEHVDVVFGSPRSKFCIPVGHITAFYNVPHISWLSSTLQLNNRTLFTTFVRTHKLITKVGQMVMTMHRMFGWKMASLLYQDRDLCSYVAYGLKEKFSEYNLTFTHTESFPWDTVLTDDLIDSFLSYIKHTSRIVYLCYYFDIRHFLLRAYHMGMCNGEYVFIYAWSYIPNDDVWRRGDEHGDVAKIAYKYLIQIAVGRWKGEAGHQQIEEFNEEVLERMSDAPWYSNYAKERNVKVHEHAIQLYDAMYLYGMWVNHSQTYQTNLRDGRAWLHFSKNKSFPCMGSPCEMDGTGDRIPLFWVFQFLGDNATTTRIGESDEKNTKLVVLQDFVWQTADGKPPRDYPECGWYHELCPPSPPQPSDDTLVIVLCLLLFTVLSCSLVTAFMVRRRRMEKDLLARIWRIDPNDLDILSARPLVGIKMSRHSGHRSLLSCSETDTGTGSSNGNISSMMDPRRALVNTAAYRGQTVVIKTVAARPVLTKADLQDLKTMREFLHDNINAFVGAYFETESPYLLFIFCPKGSLQDVLENEEIQLDLDFKISLTTDLVQGMLYIHNSSLSYHGRLKSSNCLVDNRWMLKITDYGVARFLGNSDEDTLEEQQHYKSLLWTAPELLNDPDHTCTGTRAGDIYSLGIILHEIFYRMGPFAGHGYLTTKDIYNRVKNREHEPCRPVIFSENPDVIPGVVKLMVMCWHDNELRRPTLNDVRRFIRNSIKQSARGNFVELMLQRLEKYSTNLENLVDQRTQQLLIEQQKSDKLLYRLLPEVLAEKLKSGVKVTPEVFESATLFFSDIVGFTKIAARSSPMEVVTLLNDLYVCLDSLIGKYDAYKVETIGDAYLVVSGIPNRNGQRHAGVIAELSLDIALAVSNFTITHMPDEELRIRIGNHTGPCCAGIVGMSMPRFCLFGDTVNVASQMESHGLAGRVHLSDTTHKALYNLGGYDTEYRGIIQIKDRGVMRTYWLMGHDADYKNSNDSLLS